MQAQASPNFEGMKTLMCDFLVDRFLASGRDYSFFVGRRERLDAFVAHASACRVRSNANAVGVVVEDDDGVPLYQVELPVSDERVVEFDMQQVDEFDKDSVDFMYEQEVYGVYDTSENEFSEDHPFVAEFVTRDACGAWVRANQRAFTLDVVSAILFDRATASDYVGRFYYHVIEELERTGFATIEEALAELDTSSYVLK